MEHETRSSLIHELEKLRRRNAELEKMVLEIRRASDTQLLNALTIAKAGLWEYDVLNDTFTFNDSFYRVFHTTAEKVGGYTMLSAEYARRFCHPEDAPLVAREIAMATSTADPHFQRQLEHRIIYDDGEVGWIAVRFFVVKDETGRTVKTYGVNQDITEYKKTEEKRARSEALFRSLFMSMSEGFYLSEVICDERGEPCDYRYLEVNQKFEQIMGIPRDRIIGKRYREFVPVDTTQWLENYLAVARTGEPRTFEFYSTEYNMYFETYSYRPAKGLVSVLVMNITERKRMEDRLRQVQKLEAIGMLAGGIAHDFNNLLTALMGYASLLQSEIGADEPKQEYVEEIMSASRKAVDLTRNLLAFSRQQPVHVRPVSLNEVVARGQKLLQRLVSEDVVIRTVLCPERPVIMADATQMDQVLFNLASNARDAMPGGGTLVIETKMVELGREHMAALGFGPPGRYALLSITDNGTGMDEETVKRAFDPFFTTKEVGKGTGLGLATVYGIVQQHNGHVSIHSQPGVGTTFSLYFPVVNEAVDAAETAAAPARGGDEVILIAEDDAAVRRLLSQVLRRSGYAVIEAVDGSDAIARFRAAARIDLLVIDSIMPGKNGRETYDELRGMAPDLKVLFTSGYTKDVVLGKGIEEGTFDFIMKPVSPNDLLSTVREILDR